MRSEYNGISVSYECPECLEQARLLGMGAERELALLAKNDALSKIIDKLTAEKKLIRSLVIEEAADLFDEYKNGGTQTFSGGCDDSVDLTFRVMWIIRDNITALLDKEEL